MVIKFSKKLVLWYMIIDPEPDNKLVEVLRSLESAEKVPKSVSFLIWQVHIAESIEAFDIENLFVNRKNEVGLEIFFELGGPCQNFVSNAIVLVEPGGENKFVVVMKGFDQLGLADVN